VISFTPLPLYPRRKSPRYPLYMRLGGPQSRSGRHGEVKILASPGLELRLLRSPARRQSLYRLSYPGSLTTSNTKEKNRIVAILLFYILQNYYRKSAAYFLTSIYCQTSFHVPKIREANATSTSHVRASAML
jgi:hypothetical protein